MHIFASVINGTVNNVMDVHEADCGDLDYPDSEPIGVAYLAALDVPGDIVQASPDGSFRGKRPSVGDTWDGTEFAPPA